MRVLAIETSCDETAVAVIEYTADNRFLVQGDMLYSQAAKHTEFGGVYPNLAKREHQKNLIPLTTEALQQAGVFKVSSEKIMIYHTFSDTRDEEFQRAIHAFLETTEKPSIEMIAVTAGPGLEPALWTGVTFANTLGEVWGIPVYPMNHMEGHLVSGLLKQNDAKAYTLDTFEFPVLGLLISGGHTEFVLSREWFSYELVGRTKDDAVGEAYDKVARLLNLPYPGGPLLDQLAVQAEKTNDEATVSLPRPMIHEASCDFSFSGLKTAVLYATKKMGVLSNEQKSAVAREFQHAVRDVLVSKTRRALQQTGARALAVGGGVSANETNRESLRALVSQEFPGTYFGYPARALTGDNALMIGITALLKAREHKLPSPGNVTASGSLSLA